eukprot:6184435-Alexandrium_andersonii.AAC.1
MSELWAGVHRHGPTGRGPGEQPAQARSARGGYWRPSWTGGRAMAKVRAPAPPGLRGGRQGTHGRP